MKAEDKKRIYQAYLDRRLTVLSSTKEKKLEWRPVLDVLQHNVSHKRQYEVCTVDGLKCTATEDHSLYRFREEMIEECKTSDFETEELLACVSNAKLIGKKIRSIDLISPIEHMYDLSVEENHNFVLRSGVLAHNSFRPPSHEKFLQAQTQVFGYIWEDEELYEYILMAVDYFNSAPPVTDVSLINTPLRWRTSILLGAAAFACMALAMNWIADEFGYSISGVSLDLEKSSKYESMKQNFESEFEKSRDLAKRSIKIIRGLKQPRYGIGISSALGPYSRPGVQSRRNFVSGFRGGWS